MNKLPFLLPFLCIRIAFAADPQQPKVGGTPVINATNGYAGTLTVRTQINLGLAGSEGALTTGSGGTQLLLNGSPIGGGNTIWTTNADGTIQANSSVLNSTTNYSVNLAFKATNMFRVSTYGGITSGLRAGEFNHGGELSFETNPGFHAIAVNELSPPNNTVDITLQAYDTVSDINSGANGINHATIDGGVFAPSVGVGGPEAFWGLITFDTNGHVGQFYADIKTNLAALYLGVDNGTQMQIDVTANDGSTPYIYNTFNLHTNGHLQEHLNKDILVAYQGINGGFAIGQGAPAIWGSVDDPSFIALSDLSLDGIGASEFYVSSHDSSADHALAEVFGATSVNGQTNAILTVKAGGGGSRFWSMKTDKDVTPAAQGNYFVFVTEGNTLSTSTIGFDPYNTLSLPARYWQDTPVVASSGNLAAWGNNTSPKMSLTFDGVDTTVGGFSSSATDAAVTIASTGWTNTFGKNAVVYLDGIGLTFKVANNAGTFVYTNSVALAGDSVLLQPNGKVIITGGTLGVGRATPF